MNFCSICIKVFGEKCCFIHCPKCDSCHLNNKNIFCDLCKMCINLNSDLEVLRHSKRHASICEYRKRIVKN